MAKRTSKTSHVLNLITNGEPDMPAEAPKPAAQPESATKASEAKVTVVDAEEERSQVSEEIQKQLLSQLEEETTKAEEPVTTEAPAAAQPETEAAMQQEPENPSPVVDEAVTEAIAAEHIPEKETTKEPTHMEEQEKKTEPAYDRINVMEKLLERTDVMKQMKEYGVCTCSRCHADVCALVLTRLPAKYVVAENAAVSPMISYYEAKYRMRILTEMIKSCIDVRDNPRH